MPIKKEREYRALAAPLTAQAAAKKMTQSITQEGYATTFNKPYLLYEFEDGTKFYERMTHTHWTAQTSVMLLCSTTMQAECFTRQSNKTLILVPDHKGLLVAAGCGKTDFSQGVICN